MSKKKIIFVILLLLTVIITGTFSWLSYATKKSSLVLTVGDSNNGQIKLYPYQLTGSLNPVLTYTSANYVQVTAENTGSNPAKIKLYYYINSIDSVLIDDGVKYTITKSSTLNGTYSEYINGNFSTVSNGSELVILDESISIHTTNFYRVYLWLDSSDTNQSAMQGKKLNVELKAIYNGQHTLSISSMNGGNVECTNNISNITSSSSLKVYYGDNIACTSTPNSGYTAGVLKLGTSIEKSASEFQYRYNDDENLTATFFQTETNFDYTGGSQSYSVYSNGLYKIELWGAQGGVGNSNNGIGYGGYTSGIINLKESDKIFVYVGEYPEYTSGSCYSTNPNNAFNGSITGSCAAGGGATDVRLVASDWNNDLSLNSRIMVAGGGGGSFYNGSGGSAGGLISYDGIGKGTDSSYTVGVAVDQIGTKFGIGHINTVNGGGGYYGGLGGLGGNSSGGSSYISGHTGCVAIANSNDTSKARTPRVGTSNAVCQTGSSDNLCSIHYSKKVFNDTLMIDGAGYTWTNVKASTAGTNLMPNPNGGNYASGTGNIGNGYARITFIQETDDIGYVSDNLILHYDGIMNTKSGHSTSAISWLDLSSTENNGSLNNFAYSTDSGWVDNGLKFDGANDYVLTDDSKTNFSNFAAGTNFSYCATFTTGNNDLSSWQGILSNMQSWGNGGFNLQYGSAQGIALGFGKYLNSNMTHALNQIYNVCGVYNGSNMKIYVNGELKNNVDSLISAGVSTLKLSCFYHTGASSSLPTNGIIHNVLFYNKALTLNEVYNNYLVDYGRFY